MPINYGTNNVSTSGTITGNIGGLLDRKVLYFGTGTGTWDTSSNWYYDKDLTLSANAVPTSEDTAIIGGYAYVNSAGSGISAYNIILRGSSTFSVSGQTIMVKNIVLYDSSYISVSSCTLGSASDRCDLQFYDSSYLLSTSSTSFYGDFSMYDDSYTSSSYSNSFYGNVTIKCNPSNSGKGLHSSNGSSNIYGDLSVAGSSGTSFSNSTVSYVSVWGKTTVTRAILDSCTLNNTEINYATINYSSIYGNVSAVDYSYMYYCNLYGTALLSDNSQLSSCSVYAPLYLTSYSTATSSTLYGSVYLSESANISSATFYGSVEIVGYSWISGGTFESCNVFVTQNGYITGNTTYFNGNSIIKIGYDGYIYNSSTIYLNDSSRLILSSNNTSGTRGNVNITSDYSTDGSVVEVHNLACLGSSSTINCATLEFRGPDAAGGLNNITLGTWLLKKIKLFDTSYVSSSITTPQDCIIEFHDRSYLATTLTLGTNGVAKFHDTSYNNGGTITGGSLVEFYDTSYNQSGSTISTPKAIFYGNSSIDNVTLDKTAVSLIYRNIPTQLTPPSIGSTQDNYDPGFADILRLEAQSPSQDIRGFVLKDRYLVVIVNVGSSYNLILKHQDSNSTDVNRFITPTGGDHTIPPEGTATLMYDTATTRWRVL